MNSIEQISYDCIELDCGRKFTSKDKLNDHYKNRHPDSLLHITTEQQLQEKPNSVLLSLYSKINSLEEVVQNEMKQQFNFDQMPNYDILNSSSEQEEDNKNKKSNGNNENLNSLEKNADINIIDLPYDINENTSTTIINRCSILTNEMIELGSKYDTYIDITQINLSRKNITNFRHNKDISFNDLSEVTKLNLSFNWIKYSYDIRMMNKLQEVYLNDNKIDDLTFCESLPYLEILDIENNEVSSITSLMGCNRLQILKLAQNKISYEGSTLKTIFTLKNLRELTIVNNPFIDDIFGYRHLFIYKFPFILVLDKVDIEDVDRDVARRFTFEHNPTLAVNRPNSSRSPIVKESLINKEEESIEDNNSKDNDNKELNKDILSQTQTQFRVGHTIITKQIMPIVKKTENATTQLKKKSLPKISTEAKEIKDLKKENDDLKAKVTNLEKDLQSIKLELENLRNINEHNEEIIRNYEQKESKTQVTEKENMKQKMELWKREYCELLDKTISTNTSGGNTNYLIGDIKARPQTANSRMARSYDFEKIIGEIKQIKKKNIFHDLLNEENSEEEDDSKDIDQDEDNDEDEDGDKDKDIIEKKKSFIPKTKENIHNKIIEENIPYDDNANANDIDDDDDDDIDEMLRKSYQDLQFVKKDLKELNEEYNQQSSTTNKPLPLTKSILSTIKPINNPIIKPSELQAKSKINTKILQGSNIKLTTPVRTKSFPKTETEDHPNLKSQRIIQLNKK